MPFLLKLLITNVIIIVCTLIGRKFPTLGGLIATMPLTSLLVLVWLATDNPGDRVLLTSYTRGVIWGIVPTTLFFIAAYAAFQKGLPFSLVLIASFSVWMVAAVVHQLILH